MRFVARHGAHPALPVVRGGHPYSENLTASGAGNMKITRLEACADGGSRFVEIEIPWSVERDDGLGHRLRLSTPYASPAVQFVELPAGMDQDWHLAPAAQIVVVLGGVLEVETTDGGQRRWRAGDAFLPTDLSGRGHRTRCIDGAVRLLFAPLPAGCEFLAAGKSD